MKHRIITGDVLRWAEHYKGAKFHALLCDPPYHLTSITKRYGKPGSAPAKDRDGVYKRAAAGFMGQEWDGGDIAFRPETWAALAEHLFPGAFGMAFASSRGFHRMAVAIEDAGLIIHPMIGWVYGSGFPKATRIDTQIDKAAGIKIEHGELINQNRSMSGGNYTRDKKHVAATDLARTWEGHRYGLQAMKPALEPIIVFQKPYEGKPLDSIVEHGAGALNIEGGRIGSQEISKHTYPGEDLLGAAKGNPVKGSPVYQKSQGRWPANLALSHNPGCVRVGERKVDAHKMGNTKDVDMSKSYGGYPDQQPHIHYADADGKETIPAYDCEPNCPVYLLDRQSGVLTSGSRKGGEKFKLGRYEGQQGAWGLKQGGACESSKGGASRFFHNSDWQLENAEPIRYQAKASRKERDAGLNSMSKKFAPTMGDGIGAREHNENKPGALVKNVHPTVKPIALARWLATLLLPPEEYEPRRLLVPFSGSGSEMIGAHQAGWDECLGIELGAEYVEIAEARIAHWLAQAEQLNLL